MIGGSTKVSLLYFSLVLIRVDRRGLKALVLLHANTL